MRTHVLPWTQTCPTSSYLTPAAIQASIQFTERYVCTHEENGELTSFLEG